uniref:Uncharacterized protein n=1 Tax=Panagrolaimus superbus TaxID=310955 RepID=A0A914Z0M0_9BILA
MPCESCPTQTGKNDWYNGNTPAATTGSTASAGSWARDMCAAPCICDAAGACYIPDAGQDPAITFYPHCPTPTTCFIAVLLSSQGQLTPVAGGAPFTSDDQFDENNDPRPVTDPQYLRAKSVGCAGCPVVTL